MNKIESKQNLALAMSIGTHGWPGRFRVVGSNGAKKQSTGSPTTDTCIYGSEILPCACYQPRVNQATAGRRPHRPVNIDLVPGARPHKIPARRQTTPKHGFQLEAKAHFTVQQWIDSGGLKGRMLTVESIREIQCRFYTLLPDDLLWTEEPATKIHLKVIPGGLRPRDVEVGGHVARCLQAGPQIRRCAADECNSRAAAAGFAALDVDDCPNQAGRRSFLPRFPDRPPNASRICEFAVDTLIVPNTNGELCRHKLQQTLN